MLIVLLWAVPVCAKQKRPAPPRLTVETTPAAVAQGAPVLFRLKSQSPLQSVNGNWLGRDVFFEYDRAQGIWYGLSGAPLETVTGTHPITVNTVAVGGAKESHRHKVTVKRGVYRSSALSVRRNFTEPDAATLERIEQERSIKREKFASIGKVKQWSGSFVAPMISVITGSFGTERTFNGERQSVHHGLDYRAAIGTPVLAMNRGTVILARELFFEGNCVVLDHGQGVLTLYLHLSEMAVEEGAVVEKSQSIGLSGGTGRVTAPHLHVAVRLQGVYLDPQELLKLSIPAGK